MKEDRRRLLVAGGAGLASTLLLPQSTLACFCCRQRRRASNRVYYTTCPLTWSTSNPTLPPSPLYANTKYYFYVYGSGLYDYYQADGTFYPWIVDNSNPPKATWVNRTIEGCTRGTSGIDTLKFSAYATGTSAGGSSITVTVTLTPFAPFPCAHTWPAQNVTYA